MTETDHDILIGLRTDMKYVVKFIKNNKRNIIYLTKQNQARLDWQQDFDTKTKVFIGVATFLGGIVVFVGEKLYDYFIRRS